MPAARSSSSKSKASNSRSTSKSSSSRPNGVKRVACRAWWCDSTFTRRADMLKHASSEHFGKRFYCIICYAVMKQPSNLNTHLNAHFGLHCTLCSCGRGFTDPSACTRHREATGHEKGITYRKARPIIIKPVEVQHLAGLTLNLQMISNPGFVPPLFDESYYLKGMPKPKAQEKYNQVDYLVTEPGGAPAIPSAYLAGTLLTDEVPTAEYQELAPTEDPNPAQTEIQVDKLGLNANFSYDVELLQEHQQDQVTTANVYTDSHTSSGVGYTGHCQPSSDDYYTPPGAISPYHPYHVPAPHMATNADFYSHHPTTTDNYPALPLQPFFGPRVQPEYSEAFPYPQVPNPPFESMPLPSPDVPLHNFFEGTGFCIRVPEQVQQPQFQHFYHQSYNRVYQYALAGY